MSELLSTAGKKAKQRGRPKKNLTQGKMVKVNSSDLEELKVLKDLEEKDSLADVIKFLLSTHSFVKNSKKTFIVDSELLQNTSLKEARGVAIMNAVKENRPPTLPKIMLYLGDDDGL